MNKTQIRKLNNKLDELENFIKNKPESKPVPAVEKIRKLLRIKFEDKKFEESEIIDWLAGCASFFSEVEVNQEIINHFLNFFKFTTEEASNGLVKRMGPFVAEEWRNKTYYLSSIVNSDYIKIVFRCARVNLNKMIEDERIVPAWLVEQMS